MPLSLVPILPHPHYKLSILTAFPQQSTLCCHINIISCLLSHLSHNSLPYIAISTLWTVYSHIFPRTVYPMLPHTQYQLPNLTSILSIRKSVPYITTNTFFTSTMCNKSLSDISLHPVYLSCLISKLICSLSISGCQFSISIHISHSHYSSCLFCQLFYNSPYKHKDSVGVNKQPYLTPHVVLCLPQQPAYCMKIL